MEIQDPVKMYGKCFPASCLGHLIVEGVWPEAKILKVVKLRLVEIRRCHQILFWVLLDFCVCCTKFLWKSYKSLDSLGSDGRV